MPAFQPYWGKPAPYGMIGRVEETSASFEARSAPRSHPTDSDIHWSRTGDFRSAGWTRPDFTAFASAPARRHFMRGNRVGPEEEALAVVNGSLSIRHRLRRL